MSTRKLDRNRYYAQVYGDSNDPPHRFYQDGLFFAGNGDAVDAEAAAATTPVITTTDDEAGVTKAAAKEAKAEARAEARAEKKAEEVLAERRELLEAKTPMELKHLAEKVAEELKVEPPAGGKGAKARAVDFLLEYTE